MAALTALSSWHVTWPSAAPTPSPTPAHQAAVVQAATPAARLYFALVAALQTGSVEYERPLAPVCPDDGLERRGFVRMWGRDPGGRGAAGWGHCLHPAPTEKEFEFELENLWKAKIHYVYPFFRLRCCASPFLWGWRRTVVKGNSSAYTLQLPQFCFKPSIQTVNGSCQKVFPFLPHSAVISDLLPWFPMIWEWFPMFLWSYHRELSDNHCGRNIIDYGGPCGTEFTLVSLYSTEITHYHMRFLEYKLTRVNSVLRRRPWWILYILWFTSLWPILQSIHGIIIQFFYIWVRSRNCGCLVTWFCYQMIAKPGNKSYKTAAVPWPDPYYTLLFYEKHLWDHVTICTCHDCWADRCSHTLTALTPVKYESEFCIQRI